MFDATALCAVAAELHAALIGGRVQEIVQCDERTFVFEIYAHHTRQYFYVSVHPHDARAHLISQKVRGSGQPPSPLLLLLRKHAEHAFVRAITQLPHERILQIQFDHAAEGLSTLIVETIGKYSNLILTDANGIVLDALKRVGAQINRARVTLPRHPYAPPPPQAKLSPTALSVAEVTRRLANESGACLWQTLVKQIAGVSPLLAREIAFRAQGNANAVGDPAHAAHLIALLEELTRAPWQPTLAFAENEPVAFAPYPLTQFADARPVDSISRTIELFYGSPQSYAAVKETWRVPLGEARERLARKRDSLAQALPAAGASEQLRLSGELILAYASQIQAGQTVLQAETETGWLDIALDPRQSAVANAQDYFRAYRRAQETRARVPALLAAANAEVEFAEQMLNDLDLAENRAEIDTALATARAAGLLPATQQKMRVPPSAPRQFTSCDGLTIWVGKNAKQNEELTFRRAKPNDLWLHTKHVAGAHVILVHAGREIPEASIAEAAALAVQYSQAREDTHVEVIVTPRRNVHRVRGGRTGMVTVRPGASVRVVH